MTPNLSNSIQKSDISQCPKSKSWHVYLANQDSAKSLSAYIVHLINMGKQKVVPAESKRKHTESPEEKRLEAGRSLEFDDEEGSIDPSLKPQHKYELAIEQLNAENNNLKTKNNELNDENAGLKAEVPQLKSRRSKQDKSQPLNNHHRYSP